MTERYEAITWNRNIFWCHDCGVVVWSSGVHDAFHDRIDQIEQRLARFMVDRLAAVLLQRDREDMESSGNPDTPPSAENPDSRNSDSVVPGSDPLLCAVCGEPEGFHVPRMYAHTFTLTPPDVCEKCRHRKHSEGCLALANDGDYCGCGSAPTEPPVGSGWFADKWPGVCWLRETRGPISEADCWFAWIYGDWTFKAWPDLLPGRPAVPSETHGISGGER